MGQIWGGNSEIDMVSPLFLFGRIPEAPHVGVDPINLVVAHNVKRLHIFAAEAAAHREDREADDPDEPALAVENLQSAVSGHIDVAELVDRHAVGARAHSLPVHYLRRKLELGELPLVPDGAV